MTGVEPQGGELYKIINNKMILMLKRTLRCDNDKKIKQG